MESTTLRASRLSSSKAAKRFRETSRETERQSSIDASEDRQLRIRLSARSMEQLCATDAADKNKAVATDESFPRNARRIRALQLHRKSQVEKRCHPQPTHGKH